MELGAALPTSTHCTLVALVETSSMTSSPLPSLVSGRFWCAITSPSCCRDVAASRIHTWTQPSQPMSLIRTSARCMFCPGLHKPHTDHGAVCLHTSKKPQGGLGWAVGAVVIALAPCFKNQRDFAVGPSSHVELLNLFGSFCLMFRWLFPMLFLLPQKSLTGLSPVFTQWDLL